MAQYDRFIKKIATKLQQVAEKEMKDAAPKCPFFYYQPNRPVAVDIKESEES